jgi:hypothetical protein
MYVDERVVEKSALYSERRSLIGVKFTTMWLNFESTRKAVPNS